MAQVTMTGMEYIGMVKVEAAYKELVQGIKESIQITSKEEYEAYGVINVRVKYNAVVTKIILDELVATAIANDYCMEGLVKDDAHSYSPDTISFSSYSWADNVDLRETYPEFKKAWKRAEARIAARAKAEQTEAFDEEDDTVEIKEEQ